MTAASTSRIFHKFGGRVTPTHVGHKTDDRGIPYWYVRGNVQWDDGGESAGTEIAPNALCVGDGADELPGHQQLNAVLDAMNKYLGEAGAWLREPKRMRGGVMIHWMPHEKAGEIALLLSSSGGSNA